MIARFWFRSIDFCRFSNSITGRNFIGVGMIMLFRPFDPTGWLSKGNRLNSIYPTVISQKPNYEWNLSCVTRRSMSECSILRQQ